MKSPAIQLYFGDWRSNSNLRRCSWAARGVMLEVMGLLHDSDEYGAIRWHLAEIATAIGCPISLIRELVTKNVLKGGDKQVQAYRWAPSHAGTRGPEVVLVAEQSGPLWYSSRMVRDEYKRTKRGIATRFKVVEDDVPDYPPSPSPTQRHGEPEGGEDGGSPSQPPTHREGYGASSSASSSLKTGLTDGSSTPVDNSETTGKISPGKATSSQWWKTPDGIDAEAEREGVKPIAGHSREQLKQRVFAHKAKKHRA